MMESRNSLHLYIENTVFGVEAVNIFWINEYIFFLQERILNPHAASCTCVACCDDLAVVSNTTFIHYSNKNTQGVRMGLTFQFIFNIYLPIY